MIGNKYLHFLWLMRNERRPLETLRNIQNRKLRQLIPHAYAHVPFYRQLFKKNHLHPDDIQTTDDLVKIPIIDKSDLNRPDRAFFLDQRIGNHETLKQISTSGSSGEILNFFVDRRHNQLRKAQFIRPFVTNNTGLRNPVLWFRGRPDTRKRLHQKMGFLKEHQYYSGLAVEDQIDIIQQIRPKVMRGYGSTFQLIASKILENQIQIFSPKMIFTDSELLSPASRKIIESAFQTTVIDVYGTFETENIAYECSHHKGYHMAIDCVIIEFIKNGRPAAPGEEGEIVCTVLDNYTFPFIRYNLHDLGTWSAKPCTCGRTFPLMTSISGRMHHCLVKKNGEKISTTSIIAHFWHLGKYIHEFQIIQKSLNSFSVLIVPTVFFTDSTEKKIREFMHSDLPDADIQIRLTDAIPREASGKLMVFKPYRKAV